MCTLVSHRNDLLPCAYASDNSTVSPRQQLAVCRDQNVCSHLLTMCRIYKEPKTIFTSSEMLFTLFLVKIFMLHCFVGNLQRDLQPHNEMATQTKKSRALFLYVFELTEQTDKNWRSEEEHEFEHPPFKCFLLHQTTATKCEISLPAVAPLSDAPFAVDSCLRVAH